MHLFRILLCLASSSLLSLSQTRMPDLPAITGTAVNPLEDLLWLNDSSAGTSGSKKITIAELVNVSSFTNGNFLASNSVEFSQVNGLTSALNGKLANTAEAVGTAMALDPRIPARDGRMVGFRAMESGSNKSWRLFSRAFDRASPLTAQDNARIVGLVHGDSVAQDPSASMWARFGYGGQVWPITNNNGSTAYEAFSQSPAGIVVTLTSGQSILADSGVASPTVPFHAVVLNYLAKDGNGTLKLEFRPKTYVSNTGLWSTGSWTDATREWAIEQLPRTVQTTNGHPAISLRRQVGIVAGMTVSGTGIAGGSTVTSVGYATENRTAAITNASAVITLNSVTGIAPGMYVTTADAGIPVGSFVVSINPGATQVTLSSPATATATGRALSLAGFRALLSANATATGSATATFGRTDAGSSSSGVLNTDNDTTEKFSTAIINPATTAGPYLNQFYDLRITCVSGTVQVCGMGLAAGGIVHNGVQASGYYAGGTANAGKNIGAHFSVTPEETWVRFAAWLNPDIMTFKTLNALSKSALETFWPSMTDKWKAAMPDTLFVVVGTHPYGAQPGRDKADVMVQADDYWRAWCADNDWVFVDLSASYPEARTFATDNDSADDFFGAGDFLHPSEKGQRWGDSLVMNAIAPALNPFAGGSGASSLVFKKLPFDANTIRVGGRSPGNAVYGNHFTFTHDGQEDRSVFLLSDQRSGNTGAFSGYNSGASGFSQFSNTSAARHSQFQGRLGLVSNGVLQVAFGQAGVRVGGTSDMSRAVDSFEVFNTGITNAYPTMQLSSHTGQTGAILQMYRNGNQNGSSLGNPLWAWLPSGNVEFEGTTSDAFETTYAHEEPTSDVTITRVVNATAGTGSLVRVMAPAPSYANQAAGEAAVGQWEVFYDESSKKLRVDPNP